MTLKNETFEEIRGLEGVYPDYLNLMRVTPQPHKFFQNWLFPPDNEPGKHFYPIISADPIIVFPYFW